MFGSVTTQEIADFLKREGFNVSRPAVELDEPIKQLGVYNVPVQLHPEVEATLKLWVVRSS
jgi:large subunit ribosomal protein L9